MIMKTTRFLSLLAAGLAMAAPAFAETVVTLSKVHLCCTSCVKGVEKAVSTVNGLTAVIDKDGGTVALHAADKATVQKGVDAIVGVGYFGVSNDPTVQPDAATGAPSGKVEVLVVKGLHLCCGKCVKAVNDAVGKVSGVKGTTAEKGVKSFQVTGQFQAKEVFAALQKAGLTGKAGN